MKNVTRYVVCLMCFLLISCSQSNQSSDEIEIWHWMTDRHDAFVALAERYEAETGVDVQFELFAPSETYTKKVVAAAQADVLPDMYGVLDKKFVLAKYIKAGLVADLTTAFQAENNAWKNTFFDRALAANQFREDNSYGITPGIYGVPLDVTNIQMIYNRKLLAKAGIADEPETFNEFLSAIAQLKRIGVPGLVSGFGELWLLDTFAHNYAINIMGLEKVWATYKGEVPYTDPDWVAVFTLFQTLADKDVLVEGVVTKGNKYAEQDFALERAAFAFNGSWCVNVYHDMNANLQYGVMLPPRVNDNHPMMIWGGAGSSLVVNPDSQNKKQAIAFLQWLTAREQQAYLAMETKNLPSNKEALSSIPEVLADFSQAMDHTTHPTTWPVNENPVVSEVFAKGIQSIVIGEKTPMQVAQEVDVAKKRQMRR